MPTPRLALLPLAILTLLSACGGGGHGSSSAAPASGLSGTVAVGAPITQGKLRILDATGAVVVQDVTIAADGSYPAQALTGPAPYRIEACGYAGANYTCVYSVAQGAGTANVTPLTTATVLLAAGASPDTLMTGSASGLGSSAVSDAQTRLRSGLSSVLSDAGVASNFDLIGGNLSAGSRTGYDRVLDAVGVNTGEDGSHPFVQITPRLGTGNVYIEPGAAPVGSVTVATGANALSLSGLEALFQRMSSAMASADACSNASTGIRSQLASTARMSLGGGSAITGIDNVAAGLCQFFGQGEDGNTPMWGSSLVSPVLGRCDLSGAAPVCRVSFALQAPLSEGGGIQALGGGMAVTREGGVWKFLGDADPIQLYASARVQRDVRIDGSTPVITYARALAFEVPAVSGVGCASVSQHDTNGAVSVVAYYKPHDGSAERLSLWTANSMGQDRSLDPSSGTTRSSDDTWVALPDGTAGDDVVRNFYRGGRSVTFSLFSDSACSTPFLIDGHSTFEVDVDGVPPVSASLTALPWPEPDSATRTALKTLAIANGATGSLNVAWGSSRSGVGVNGVTVCGDRAQCGQDGTGRIGDKDVRPGASSATVPLNNRGPSLVADSYKMLALYGRTGDGMGLQSNYMSCPQTATGESCH